LNDGNSSWLFAFDVDNNELEFVGSSSDMIVMDLGENNQNYRVGDLVEFKMNYLGLLSLLNSNYIEKRVV